MAKRYLILKESEDEQETFNLQQMQDEELKSIFRSYMLHVEGTMKIPEGWPTKEMLKAARLEVRGSKAMQKLSDEWFAKKFKAALSAAPTPPAKEAVTDTYVQPVPDKCDRITWRGSYYHLPIQPAQHGPDFPDGCDSEGFPGGCERFGHTPETCPNAQEDEPILRIYHHKGGVGIAGSINHLPDGTKLYTRPADDKPRGTPVGASDGCETRVARYYTAEDDKLRKTVRAIIELVDRNKRDECDPIGLQEEIEELTQLLRVAL